MPLINYKELVKIWRNYFIIYKKWCNRKWHRKYINYLNELEEGINFNIDEKIENSKILNKDNKDISSSEEIINDAIDIKEKNEENNCIEDKANDDAILINEEIDKSYSNLDNILKLFEDLNIEELIIKLILSMKAIKMINLEKIIDFISL